MMSSIESTNCTQARKETEDPWLSQKRGPSSEELTEWMQENEVIKLTIKQKFKVDVRKYVSSASTVPAMS